MPEQLSRNPAITEHHYSCSRFFPEVTLPRDKINLHQVGDTHPRYSSWSVAPGKAGSGSGRAAASALLSAPAPARDVPASHPEAPCPGHPA